VRLCRLCRAVRYRGFGIRKPCRGRSADCKSAIQQIENLRYARAAHQQKISAARKHFHGY